MKPSEWKKIAAIMCLRWPQSESKLTPEVIELWYQDLAEFSAEQVNAAVEAIYRDGKEWAPNGAQIRAKLIELSDDTLPWGEAYGLLMEAVQSHGGWYTGLDWLREQNPLVAEAAEAYGWDDFCHGTGSDGTCRSQFRDIYLGLTKREGDKAKYKGLNSGGLKVLDQAGKEPVRFGELIQGSLTDGD